MRWQHLEKTITDYVAALAETGFRRPGGAVAQPQVPLDELIRPRAEAVFLRRLANGRNWYEFSFWLDVPAERLDEVEAVGYDRDHPTFKQRWIDTANPRGGFRASYEGWGCLRRVGVRVTLRNGRNIHTGFDMCRALGWR